MVTYINIYIYIQYLNIIEINEQILIKASLKSLINTIRMINNVSAYYHSTENLNSLFVKVIHTAIYRTFVCKIMRSFILIKFMLFINITEI